ncbi:hypothetical protein AAG570_010229 [Ranatra chinensis]|uniref:Uncharacterized protein n=1 Tax=Ranatra chinensis TaxID=642074 RepID=A0ABD0YM10_9HEMI
MPDQRNGHQMQHGSILRPVRSTVHLPDSYSANFIGTPHGALAVPSHFNITGTPLARHDLPTRDLERHIFSREIDGIREPVDFDEALKETVEMAPSMSRDAISVPVPSRVVVRGCFGRFHCWLTLVCGLIYFTSSASTTLLSLLLPASACQLHISSTDRGLINASPLAGKNKLLIYC